MAAGYSFGAHPYSFDNSPFLDGFNGVLRTGGDMSAMRAQKRGNAKLIKANWEYEYLFKHSTKFVFHAKAQSSQG
jgi:hypothetical protein